MTGVKRTLQKSVISSHSGSFTAFTQELHLRWSSCHKPLLELYCSHVYARTCAFLVWSQIAWPQTCLITMVLSGVVESAKPDLHHQTCSVLFVSVLRDYTPCQWVWGCSCQSYSHPQLLTHLPMWSSPLPGAFWNLLWSFTCLILSHFKSIHL